MVKKIVKAASAAAKKVKATAKTTGGVLKAAGKVAGIGYVTDGAQDVIKGLSKGNIKKAVKGAVKTAAGVALVKNHTEWYTKGNISLLGSPNIQQQDGRPLIVNTVKAAKEIRISIPNHLSFVGRLTIPDTSPVVTNDDVDSTTASAIPSYGWTQGIQQLQNTLRAVNTSARTYTPGHVESYILQDRAVIACLGMAYRALQWVSHYDRDDIAIPAVHIKMMGLNKEDLINNKQNYASRLMQLFHKHAKLVPLNLDLFDRTWWLTSNIFRDDDKISKDDDFLYMIPTIDGFFASSIKPGTMVPLSKIVAGNPGYVTTPGASTAWDAYPDLAAMLNTADELLNVFVQSSEMADISADIWKAYGAGAQFKHYNSAVNTLEKVFTGVYQPVTTYDRAICDQFMNADLCDGVNDNICYANGKFGDEDSTFAGTMISPWTKDSLGDLASITSANLTMEVSQFDTSVNPYSSAANKANKYGIITIPDEAVEPGKVLSLSRFKSKVYIQEGKLTAPRRVTRRYSGTEIVCYVAPIATVDDIHSTPIFAFDYELQDNLIATCVAGCNVYNYNNLGVKVPSTSQLAFGIVMLAQNEIMSFPRICIQPDLNKDETTEGVALGLSGRFDVWAPFPSTLCESYHSVCAFSLLYVDQRIRPLNNVITV